MNNLATQVLPTDSIAKLLRVFCFLRQHDCKARIARKTIELKAWRSLAPPVNQCLNIGPADEEVQLVSFPMTMPDKTALLNELDLLAANVETDGASGNACWKRDKDENAGSSNATAIDRRASRGPVTIQELRSEIAELQKGLVMSTNDTSGVISAADLTSCMLSLGRAFSKGEVQWMIWEVDDDLDGNVSWDELKSCYVRAVQDSHGIELNQLYYLIQFLLCDTDSSQTVSADEVTAELRRIGATEHLTAKLWSVLRNDSEEQQLLRKLTLSEFLNSMLSDLPANFNLLKK